MSVIWIWLLLMLLGIFGAFISKQYENNRFWATAGLFITGLLVTVLWIKVLSLKNNMVILTAMWDAIYAISWLIGICIFFRLKPTATQIFGTGLIICGMWLIND